MSQAPSGGGIPLGTARVDFVGDTTGLKAAAAEAVAVTEGAATAANAAGDKAGKSVAKGFRDARKEILGTVGAIGAVVAAVDRLLKGVGEFQAAGAGIVTQFEQIQKGLAAAYSAGQLSDTEKEIRRINDNAAAESRRLNEEFENRSNSISGVFTSMIEETMGTKGDMLAFQLAQIENERQKAIAAATTLGLEKQQGEEAVKATESRASVGKDLLAVQREVMGAEREFLTAEQEINATLEDRLHKIEQLRDTTLSVPDKALSGELDKLEARTREIARRQAQAIADEVSKALEKSVGGVLKDIRRESASIFGGTQITAQLTQIAGLLKLIERQRRDL